MSSAPPHKRFLKTVVPTFSPYGPILGARKDTFLPSNTAPVDDTGTAFLAVVACNRLDKLPGHFDYLYQMVRRLDLPIGLSAVTVMILPDVP